jgi:hypothetical protein
MLAVEVAAVMAAVGSTTVPVLKTRPSRVAVLHSDHPADGRRLRGRSTSGKLPEWMMMSWSRLA